MHCSGCAGRPPCLRHLRTRSDRFDAPARSFVRCMMASSAESVGRSGGSALPKCLRDGYFRPEARSRNPCLESETPSRPHPLPSSTALGLRQRRLPRRAGGVIALLRDTLPRAIGPERKGARGNTFPRPRSSREGGVTDGRCVRRDGFPRARSAVGVSSAHRFCGGPV